MSYKEHELQAEKACAKGDYCAAVAALDSAIDASDDLRIVADLAVKRAHCAMKARPGWFTRRKVEVA